MKKIFIGLLLLILLTLSLGATHAELNKPSIVDKEIYEVNTNSGYFGSKSNIIYPDTDPNKLDEHQCLQFKDRKVNSPTIHDARFMLSGCYIYPANRTVPDEWKYWVHPYCEVNEVIIDFEDTSTRQGTKTELVGANIIYAKDKDNLMPGSTIIRTYTPVYSYDKPPMIRAECPAGYEPYKVEVIYKVTFKTIKT